MQPGSHRLRRAVVLSAAACGIAAAAGFLTPPAASAASPDVVISEVYGGGGNTGAPYANDYVELYNRGASAVSLSGWSVQYASASGTTYLVTALSGSVASGGHYLVKGASGGSGGAALPAADAVGTTNMSATSGKVALVTGTSALTCGLSCHAAAGVKDFVGYGSANDYEAAPAPTTSNTKSATRSNPASDTDNNAADFAAAAPTPQNSQGGACPTGTRIRDVQGAGHISPKNGTAVSGVQGIVTGKKSNGFYLQDWCPDSNDATSEGVLVYTSSAPAVSVGDKVSVNGTVSEYRASSAGSLTVTEITSPTTTVLAGGQALPAPVTIGSGGRVPPSTVIEDDASNVETGGVFDPASDGVDFWESLEGMRISFGNAVAVGPYDATYGEIAIAQDDATTTVRTNRGGLVVRSTDSNPELVIADDAALAGATPAGTNVGDHFSGPMAGVVDYLAGGYRVELTTAVSRVSGGIAPESAAPTPAGKLSVATFNVENLTPADPQSKFDGLGAAIVNNLKSPTVVVVEEIQDNDGATNSATVAADQTWGKLIAAISAAGGPAYSYKQIDPVDDQDGGQPGGNIRQGFLYRTDTGLAWGGGTPGGSTQAVVATATGNQADPIALNVNPGRIDPANTAFSSSRKPLVGKFFFNGKPVFVIGNHWNSKGGDEPIYSVHQPPVRSSETQRGQQADAVAAFYNTLKAIDPNVRAAVAGDLNDFQFSTAVGKLTATGLTDLPATLPAAEQYTYVYLGNSQVLDHILLAPALATPGYAYDIVHINSEFATQLSDHDPQVVQVTV